jgi:hypothetical protein
MMGIVTAQEVMLRKGRKFLKEVVAQIATLSYI